jgi:ABC-type transport system involved in Fe-S cluster assembly fused permease/ATPase subunit
VVWGVRAWLGRLLRHNGAGDSSVVTGPTCLILSYLPKHTSLVVTLVFFLIVYNILFAGFLINSDMNYLIFTFFFCNLSIALR